MSTTDTPALDLHHITVLPSGNYRVRVQIKGIWHGRVHDEVDFAIAERDALMTHAVPRKKKKWDAEEIERQKALMPPGETLRNIYFTKSGCFVELGRGYGSVYGGHFSGPHAIRQALDKRAQLEKDHPSTR